MIERSSDKNQESEGMGAIGDSQVYEKEKPIIDYPRLNLYGENEVDDSTLRNSSFLTNNMSAQNGQQQHLLAKSLGLFLLGQDWEQDELKKSGQKAFGNFSE